MSLSNFNFWFVCFIPKSFSPKFFAYSAWRSAVADLCQLFVRFYCEVTYGINADSLVEDSCQDLILRIYLVITGDFYFGFLMHDKIIMNTVLFRDRSHYIKFHVFLVGSYTATFSLVSQTLSANQAVLFFWYRCDVELDSAQGDLPWSNLGYFVYDYLFSSLYNFGLL